MNENDQTLAAYEQNVQKYVDGTPAVVDGCMKIWIDRTLKLVPKDGNILEIGTATGRDADYIEAQGYTVKRTDAAQAFVDLQREYGHKASLLNAITDELSGPYDLLFADAVLLHLTEAQVTSVLHKAHTALKSRGILAFTVKTGEGEAWLRHKLDADRYFKYWQANELRLTLEQNHFKIVELRVTEDNKWLHVIARK